MDETQKRRISAKEFLERNKRVGLGVLVVFFVLLVAYFSIIFLYKTNSDTAPESAPGILSTSTNTTFENLLPIFGKTEQSPAELDEDFLNNFGNPNSKLERVDGEDSTKVIKIEERPVAGYVVFDKPISIKNYIKNKPKICSEKVEPVLKRDEQSTTVLTFQNLLKSIEGFEETPTTGILDQETREKIYTFQKRYAEILYAKKTDKTPTRLIDTQTTHFLNLLCGNEKEKPDDFVQVPTLRYVVKETREIFDYNTDSKEKTQLEAKIAPGTQEALFSKSGNLAVFRKDLGGSVDSILYNIRNKSITHLENNITTIDFNDKESIYYGIPGYSGITIKGYDPLRNTAYKIASLPLNEWNLKAVGTKELFISNKPTAYAESIVMVLNTETRKLKQLAGPLSGLSLEKTNVPDFILLSVGGVGTSKTLLLNSKNRNLGDFGINTFAEKCAQNIFADGVFCAVPKQLPENFTYPDDWYKGKVRTEDMIVYKSLKGTTTKIVSALENRPFSVLQLNVTKNGIFFIDENSLNLYSLEI